MINKENEIKHKSYPEYEEARIKEILKQMKKKKKKKKVIDISEFDLSFMNKNFKIQSQF
jgi:hypothetical protein